MQCINLSGSTSKLFLSLINCVISSAAISILYLFEVSIPLESSKTREDFSDPYSIGINFFFVFSKLLNIISLLSTPVSGLTAFSFASFLLNLKQH